MKSGPEKCVESPSMCTKILEVGFGVQTNIYNFVHHHNMVASQLRTEKN